MTIHDGAVFYMKRHVMLAAEKTKGSVLYFAHISLICRDFLLKIGDAVLAEASPYDKI